MTDVFAKAHDIINRQGREPIPCDIIRDARILLTFERTVIAMRKLKGRAIPGEKLMKKGDMVCIVGMPDGLPEDEVREIELCEGHVFPIIDITDLGLVELEIGEALGTASYITSIWLQPKYVEPAEA